LFEFIIAFVFVLLYYDIANKLFSLSLSLSLSLTVVVVLISLQSGVSIQPSVRDATGVTQLTERMTDKASDRPFHTPSYIINIKLLAVFLL